MMCDAMRNERRCAFGSLGDDLVERLLQLGIGEERADFAREGDFARLDEIERLPGADRLGDVAEAFRERKRGRILPGEKALRHLAEQAGADRRAALDLVAREAEDGGVEAAGKRERIAHRPVQRRRAFAPAPRKKSCTVAPCSHLGVGRAGMQAAVVVGRGEENLAMRVGVGRLEVVAIGQLADFFRRERGEAAVADFLRQRLAIAVARLEAAEEQHEPLEVLDGEQLVDVDQRMRDAVRQLLLAQIGGELVDVRAQVLDFLVLRLVQVPDEQMDFAAVGKVGGHFLAEKNVGVMRDRLAAVEPVVVGDRLEGHARRVELAVERLRLAVTLRHAEPAQDPLARAVREAGVELEINAQHNRRRWWVGSRA